MATRQHSSENQRRAEELVSNPRETLAQELKEWLNPAVDDDRANLVKAILAMRNHEYGGLVAIGISDSGVHQPLPGFDVAVAYQQQTIQEIVSTFASRKFEVDVLWVEFKQVRYPVIAVAGGVDMPVVCRSAIGQVSIAA
jgi:Putative DNA-binding domain